MYVYKTTNLITGKIYVGQCSKTIEDSELYIGSGKILGNSIKKYGIENFKKEILETCNSKKQLNEREIFWIKELDSTNVDVGYNISTGGNGGNLGDSVNKMISNTISKLHTDPESIYNSEKYKNKMRLVYDSRKGRPVSESTRAKISSSQKGENGYWFGKKNKLHSEKMRKMYALGELTPWNKGMHYDDELRSKISEAHKGQVPWNKGKKNIYSDDTKKKMSDAKLGIPNPKISEKLKLYYKNNQSVKCKTIIDTRSGIEYNKVNDLRSQLNLSEYMYKKLLKENILVWKKTM